MLTSYEASIVDVPLVGVQCVKRSLVGFLYLDTAVRTQHVVLRPSLSALCFIILQDCCSISLHGLTWDTQMKMYFSLEKQAKHNSQFIMLFAL